MLFVKVSDSSENSTTDEEVIELPVEPEGYILMSTLIAQFPGACGLKFKTEQSSWRGVRVVDDKIYPPGEDKWDEENVYHVTYPKDSKRKGDDLDINSAKSRKIEKKCVDLIVLGIPWKSTDETVKRYFEQYGEVVLCEIKRDASNNSKGFGFVRFKEYDNQCSVLGKKHFIDGRWCDVKIPNSQEPETSRKIFVGRLTETLTSKDLQEHFSKYGQVIDVYIPKPFRAFGFVTFVEAEVARSLCGESHIIKGVSVHVSRADPKDDDFEPNGSSAGGYNHHYHQQHGGAPNHHYHHTGMTRSQSHYHPANSYSPNGYSSHHRADPSSRSSKPMNQQRGSKSYKQDHHHHHHHDSYDRGMRSGGGSGNGVGGGGYNHQSNGNGVPPGGGGNMGPNDVTAMMTNMFNPMMAAFIQQLAAQTQQQQQQQSPNPYAPPPPPQAMMDSPAAWNHMPVGNFVPPPNGSGGAPMPPSMPPSSNHYHHSARMKPDKKF